MGLKHLRRIATGADVVRADRKLDRVEAETLMRQIASDPNVEYVEVDKLNKPMLTPNDPSYGQQWGYSGTYGIRANQAWDVTNGAGAVVAVLDTGITNHSDLNANILPGYDFIVDTAVSNDGNGRDSDPSDPGDWVTANQCGGTHAAQNSSWHGTHVAGTIAAVTNNAKGVAGVAHGAKIVPVRVLGTCGGYDSDIADAIIWASGGTVSGVPANANPVEVINMSLGGPSGKCGTTMQNAINSAVGRGAAIVVSAGNYDSDASIQSPANCSNVITVAATDSSGVRAEFYFGGSNYGSVVDVAAPGKNILSTLNAGAATPGSENYVYYEGTSMAAPHVAGVVALMQSAAQMPKTPAEVEQILKETALPFSSAQDKPIGAGIVSAVGAVNAVIARAYIGDGRYQAVSGGAVFVNLGVNGRSGQAPRNAKIDAFIEYNPRSATPMSHMDVDLVGPSGNAYRLYSGDSRSLGEAYVLDLSNEPMNGTWKLKVTTTALPGGDTAYPYVNYHGIDQWTLTM